MSGLNLLYALSLSLILGFAQCLPTSGTKSDFKISSVKVDESLLANIDSLRLSAYKTKSIMFSGDYVLINDTLIYVRRHFRDSTLAVINANTGLLIDVVKLPMSVWSEKSVLLEHEKELWIAVLNTDRDSVGSAQLFRLFRGTFVKGSEILAFISNGYPCFCHFDVLSNDSIIFWDCINIERYRTSKNELEIAPADQYLDHYESGLDVSLNEEAHAKAQHIVMLNNKLVLTTITYSTVWGTKDIRIKNNSVYWIKNGMYYNAHLN